MKIEERISRICWNTNNWSKPSGKVGKSTMKSSFEYENSFGYEEWLLDITKIIDGYHYAFIEPINKFRPKYIGKTFNINLISFDSDSKLIWRIGRIKNVIAIDFALSERILKHYKSKNWFKEMKMQLLDVNAKAETLESTEDKDFFNIKFKLEDMDLFESPISFLQEKSGIKSLYYNLLHIPEGFVDITSSKFEFKGKSSKNEEPYNRDYSKFKSKINRLHNSIQNKIINILQKQYGETNVVLENHTGRGTYIDVCVKLSNNVFNYIFFEIKTNNILKQTIREALAQLLEYSLWQKELVKAKLVIITILPITTDAKNYINNLRNVYGIPIYIQRFNLNNNELEIIFPISE